MVYILLFIAVVWMITSKDKINAKFKAATAEELEEFQRTVFAHMDNLMESYKNEMLLIKEESLKEISEEVERRRKVLDAGIDMLKREKETVEKRYESLHKDIEEKIKAINNFKGMNV